MTDRPLRPALILCYAVLWTALAVSPVDRAGWALENLLVLGFALGLLTAGRRLVLSRSAMLCVFVFLCLHAIGAHYTYSLVPYDHWTQALTGRTASAWLGLDRNHYDRLVHLAWGLLLTGAVGEVLLQVAPITGPVRRVLSPLVIVSLSAAYEIVEWGAALAFGGDLGITYVGAQGDAWDAQKDMALATLGSLVATAAAVVRERRRA